MKLSHSKLQSILQCPMSYYLNYIQGITKKEEKTALAIGSGVHWGIEHDTEDLTEYWSKSFKTRDAYTRDQLLSEAMVHGYMKHKDEIFDKILTCSDGSKMKLLDEQHEVYLTSQLNSNLSDIEYNDFVGIIDLLLLTDKGFVIIDYKTSTFVPDWDGYLDQIYRYIKLVTDNFPNIPIVKIGIVNIRKTAIRQKKNENQIEFYNRMKFEYDVNDEEYVNYHEFLPESLDKNFIDSYIKNLCRMCDFAHTIDKNKSWYINYAAAKNQYGKSDYWDIFYRTPGAEVLYKISDRVWDDNEDIFKDYRDCNALDMQVIDKTNILNKYKTFKNEYLEFCVRNNNANPSTTCCDLALHDEFIAQLNHKYEADANLLEKYTNTLKEEIKQNCLTN